MWKQRYETAVYSLKRSPEASGMTATTRDTPGSRTSGKVLYLQQKLGLSSFQYQLTTERKRGKWEQEVLLSSQHYHTDRRHHHDTGLDLMDKSTHTRCLCALERLLLLWSELNELFLEIPSTLSTIVAWIYLHAVYSVGIQKLFCTAGAFWPSLRMHRYAIWCGHEVRGCRSHHARSWFFERDVSIDENWPEETGWPHAFLPPTGLHICIVRTVI